MKNFIILFFLLFSKLYSQSPFVINVECKYKLENIKLDSIVIESQINKLCLNTSTYKIVSYDIDLTNGKILNGVGINDHNIYIKRYVNNTDNFEFFITSDGLENGTVDIYDLNGRNISNWKIILQQGNNFLKFKIISGMHILRFNINNKITTFKIIGSGQYNTNTLNIENGQTFKNTDPLFSSGDLLKITCYPVGFHSNNIKKIVYHNDPIKIFTSKPCPNEPTILDSDNNSYNTVLIGNRCWIKENLKTTKTLNGQSIQNGKGKTILNNSKYWFDYNDEPSNYDYGKLYSGGVINDVCMNGWHLSNLDDWCDMETSFDNSITNCDFDPLNLNVIGETIGYKLKSNSPYWNGDVTTNETGFSGLAGGSRGYEPDSYGGLETWGYWWINDNNQIRVKKLKYGVNGIYDGMTDLKVGFSVRCVKNY